MKPLLQWITDRVTTKRGMWITLSVWFLAAMILAVFAPSAKDYEVSSIASLPEDAQAVIAQNKVDEYFKDNEGVPAILVFESTKGELEQGELISFLDQLEKEEIHGLKELIPLEQLPPQAIDGFFSGNRKIALLPLTFDSSLETKEIKNSIDEINGISEKNGNFKLYVTGPAGIAADTLDLFSRADLVLLFSTVGIILVLLVITYRSPLLALIPLLAAAFVYEVVNQTLGLLGKAGVVLANQSLSIMTILLFAVVIDYSLLVFSRFREELKTHDDKYKAMKWAMRGTGIPLFYSGSTILAAMLILFFAKFGDYKNFAPIFGTTIIIVLLAGLTLIPALFTLFGRRSFWPKIPRIGDERLKASSLWGRVGRFVTQKPGLSIAVIGTFLLLSSANVFNLKYEFDTMKSFPSDMSSRVGYELLEGSFNKGELAPTTVLFESKKPLTAEDQQELRNQLSDQPLVGSVRLSDSTEDEKVIAYSMIFKFSPYEAEAMDALEKIRGESDQIVKDSGLDGNLYFAGETAVSVDDRSINNRDLIVIVVLETILIFSMLIFLTRSVRMPIYMMGTILLSFLAALGLGMFLTNLLFDIDTVSNRVPLYSFIFLVALGIDYNIILVSRFMEERQSQPLRKAVETAVSATGGVISSAGIILAATFAVLMTQPIELLFVFGFIVAIGILMDTFLIRGVLMPGLLVLFEKDHIGKASKEEQ